MGKRSSSDPVVLGAVAAVMATLAGFALGLKRLVWTLWAILAAGWVLVFLAAWHPPRGGSEDAIYFVVTFIPPVVAFVVVRVLAGIAEALVGRTRLPDGVDTPEHGERPSSVG